MAAAAGALKITLEKRGVYSLAGGNTPLTTATIRRAIHLADATAALIVLFSGGVAIGMQTIQKKLRENYDKKRK